MLTQSEAQELLDYNEEDGLFRWRAIGKGVQEVGQIAGCLDDLGYVIIKINQVTYKAHRLVFLYVDGYLPENPVDHINRIPWDNRRINLREVSVQCNSRNCKLQRNSSSGVTGVNVGNPLYRGKWRATIIEAGKKVSLGSFPTIEEAAMARWKAEVKYEWPNCNTTSSAYMYLKEKGLI